MAGEIADDHMGFIADELEDPERFGLDPYDPYGYDGRQPVIGRSFATYRRQGSPWVGSSRDFDDVPF